VGHTVSCTRAPSHSEQGLGPAHPQSGCLSQGYIHPEGPLMLHHTKIPCEQVTTLSSAPGSSCHPPQATLIPTPFYPFQLITASLGNFQAEAPSCSPQCPLTWIISAGSSPSVMISTWALPCRSLSRMARARSLALLRSRMLDFPPHQAKMFCREAGKQGAWSRTAVFVLPQLRGRAPLSPCFRAGMCYFALFPIICPLLK
jgi:hypothetical protein